MDKKIIRQAAFPLVAALIWGSAFVFQSKGAEYVGAFTFSAVRSAVAALFLGLFLLVRRLLTAGRSTVQMQQATAEKKEWRWLLYGGLACGVMLTVATNLQQFGLTVGTTPGKAAFITALYVVLVPLCGLFFSRRVGLPIWIGVVLAVVGLYFLCIDGALRIEQGDLLVFLCALAFTCHILIIDRVSPHVDGIALSCVQFTVITVISGVAMFLFESPTWADILAAAWPIFYVGVFSGGVAYTLQILAQKGSNPTVVSLLLSLESVFAVLTEGLLQGQWPGTREWLGCILMLTAVVLAQWPEKKKA